MALNRVDTANPIWNNVVMSELRKISVSHTDMIRIESCTDFHGSDGKAPKASYMVDVAMEFSHVNTYTLHTQDTYNGERMKEKFHENSIYPSILPSTAVGANALCHLDSHYGR